MSYREVAETANATGGPIVGRANVTSTGAARAYAAMIVDVRVDPDTGKTDVVRCTAFQDAGIAIHPSYVEGQIQGGAAQGIGWALNEEYNMAEDGHMNNTSLLDYRMPTALDLPMIEAVIVEVPNPNHPFGIRGVGEAGNRAAARRHGERGVPRHRRPHDRPADESARRRRIAGPEWRMSRFLCSQLLDGAPRPYIMVR